MTAFTASGNPAAALVLLQTSDVANADRRARVREDAEVSVDRPHHFANCRNACEGGSHAGPRCGHCCIHEERHHPAGRVLPTGFLGLEGLLLVAGIAAVPVPWRDVSS